MPILSGERTVKASGDACEGGEGASRGDRTLPAVKGIHAQARGPSLDSSGEDVKRRSTLAAGQGCSLTLQPVLET